MMQCSYHGKRKIKSMWSTFIYFILLPTSRWTSYSWVSFLSNLPSSIPSSVPSSVPKLFSFVPRYGLPVSDWLPVPRRRIPVSSIPIPAANWTQVFSSDSKCTIFSEYVHIRICCIWNLSLNSTNSKFYKYFWLEFKN